VGNENSAKIAIYGDRGMVRLDSEKPFEIEACSGKLDFTTGSAHTFKVPKSFQAEQMDSFVKNVVGNPDRYLPGLEDGVRCQKILDAMVDSDRNGKWVDV
jgi:predicted dehydrogenase